MDTVYDKHFSEKREKLILEIELMERKIRQKFDQHVQRQKESLYKQVDLLITKMQKEVQHYARSNSKEDRQRSLGYHVSEDLNGNHKTELMGPQLFVNGSPLNGSFRIKYVHPNVQDLNLDNLNLGKVELISDDDGCPGSSRHVQKRELAVSGTNRTKVVPETSRRKAILTRAEPVDQKRDQGDGNSSDDETENGQDYTNVPKKGDQDKKLLAPIPTKPLLPHPIPAPRQKDGPRVRSRSLETNMVQGNPQSSSYINANVLCNNKERNQHTRASPVLRALSAGANLHNSRMSRIHETDREPVKIVNGNVCLSLRK